MEFEKSLNDSKTSEAIESEIHEVCLNGDTKKFLNLINEAEHLDIQVIYKKRTLIQAVKNKNFTVRRGTIHYDPFQNKR